jgi:hypothetical protein
VIAGITLNGLFCTAESNGDGSHPYLWVVLLKVDDQTIGSGELVDAVSYLPGLTGAQLVIKQGMHTGDTASISDLQAHLVTQFDSAETTKNVILVAVLWDDNDTPFDAVAAGYDAFLFGTRDAIAAKLPALNSTAGGQAVIDEVKAAINTKVHDAISGKLSAWDKFNIWPGTETLDSVIGNAFVRFDLTKPTPSLFNLDFGAGSQHAYRIDCSMSVTDDPCESELIEVRGIQDTIANIRGALQQLSTHENKQDQIDKLETELSAQQARLTTAEAELNQCQIRSNIGPGRTQ